MFTFANRKIDGEWHLVEVGETYCCVEVMEIEAGGTELKEDEIFLLLLDFTESLLH